MRETWLASLRPLPDCCGPVGLFAFSLEAAPQADYILQPNRRYAHSLGYIHRLVREIDFDEPAVNPVNLRRQGEDHAGGLIVVLRRNGSKEDTPWCARRADCDG
jgi:predicted TPR repeat methyltransferase